MSQDPEESGAEVHTLGILEQLRSESGILWRATSDFYFRVDKLLRELENPNLHEIANLHHRVELWDHTGQHVRWVIAACGTVTIGHAAFDAAIKSWPNERFSLRNGIQLIREHPPKKRGE
jgi:hypothetical protein